MKLRYKVASVLLIVLVLFVAALAGVLSYNSACSPAPALAAGPATMKAVVRGCYGSADKLEISDIARPDVKGDEVLVNIHAVSVNPIDWHNLTGTPYIMRLDTGLGAPKSHRLGVDFAGTVEAVGPDVEQFKPGDKVFGGKFGAFARYISIHEGQALVRMPDNVTFEQSAAVPVAAVTALQALRDHGKLKPGQKVLINGASGGVGTFAVQIAKAYGAEVTGVSSTRNLDLVRSLGADHVIDYTHEDYIEQGQRYDLIIDNVGNHSVLSNTRVLNPGGRLVVVGAQKGNWIKPLLGVIQTLLVSPFIKQKAVFFVANLSMRDLTTLAQLMQTGKVTPVIDRRYPLRRLADAIRYSEAGHARGKIIIKLD